MKIGHKQLKLTYEIYSTVYIWVYFQRLFTGIEVEPTRATRTCSMTYRQLGAELGPMFTPKVPNRGQSLTATDIFLN